jgi:hypothetical protein
MPSNTDPSALGYEIGTKGTSTYQCCGSVAFWYGSRSGDPYLGLTDQDPAIFVSDLQDENYRCFFAYYFLKLYLHIFSKIRSHKQQ